MPRRARGTASTGTGSPVPPGRRVGAPHPRATASTAGGTGPGKDDGAPEGIGGLPRFVTVHAYDQVYRLLRHAIASGTLAPGTRVVEASVAEQLEVSRTPVRDALRRLESDGLLVRSGSVGLKVTEFSPDELEDIFTIRREFDRLTARLAASRASPADWDGVRRLVEELGRVHDLHGSTSYEFSLAHEAVHVAIYGLAFTAPVARMLSEGMISLVEMASELSYPGGAPEEPARVQHERLVDEMASGSIRRALAAVDEHCRDAELATRAYGTATS